MNCFDFPRIGWPIRTLLTLFITHCLQHISQSSISLPSHKNPHISKPLYWAWGLPYACDYPVEFCCITRMAAVIVEYSFPPMFENARNEGESESVTAGPDWHTEMSAASVLCLPVFMFYATKCKLHANILSQWVYKENSLICLMETRQDNTITESQNQDGFHILVGQIFYFAQIVLDTVSILRRHVGGLCWSSRPKYLSQEFGQFWQNSVWADRGMLVYISLSANITHASEANSCACLSDGMCMPRFPISCCHSRGFRGLQTK